MEGWVEVEEFETSSGKKTEMERQKEDTNGIDNDILPGVKLTAWEF